MTLFDPDSHGLPAWAVKLIRPDSDDNGDGEIDPDRLQDYYARLAERARAYAWPDLSVVAANVRRESALAIDALTRPASDEAGGAPEQPSESADAAARAIGVLVAHSDWNNGRIATTIGVNVKTLSKKTPAWDRFRVLRKMLREQSRRGVRSGSKDKDGNMEAWDDDADER